jgi:signal transduction histidine kinase
MTGKRYISFLAVVTVVLMAMALASELLYFSELDYKLRTRRFNKILAEKEKITEECLESLKIFMEHSEAQGSMSKEKIFRLAEQEGITILEYFNSSNLVYWSDNSFDVPKVIDSNLFDKPFVFIQNGWFLTKTVQTGSEKIVGLLRIRTDYGFENELVKNGFEKAFHVPANVGFSRDRNSSPYHVFNSKGDFLFSLIFPGEKDINYLIIIPLVLWTIFFLLIIFITVEFVLSLARRKKYLYALFVPVAIFAIVYSVFLVFSKPAVFFQTDLFSPYVFTLNNFIPSLGHLFLLSVLLSVISWIFYISLPLPVEKIRNNGNNYFILTLLLSAGAVLLALLHSVFSKLIFASNINFEPFKVLEISISTVFGISSMILLLLVPLLFLIKLFAAVKNVSRVVIIISVLTSLMIFLAASFSFNAADFPIAFFYVSVVAFAYYTARKQSGNFRLAIIFSLIFGLYALNYITILSEKKATDNIKVMAVSYSGENDPEAEYQLLDLWPELLKDTTLAGMMKAEYPVADVNKIRKYLNEKYFYGYWGNYNFDIIICRNDSPLWIESDNRFAENCFGFFEERIRKFGYQLTGTNFYFIDNQGGRAYYLGQMTFDQGSGIINRLFIELYADIDVFHAGYSELLLDKKYQGYSKLKSYSFAKYINGELALRTGEYPYQKSDNEYIGNDSEYNFFRAEGYNHTLFKNGNVTVIISRPLISWVDNVISFAYLFVFTLLFSSLLLLLIKRPEPARLVSFNFRQKLQVSFISILLFSLIAIGIVVAFYTINQYQARHYENIKEKMNSVYLELASRLEAESALSSDWRDDNNSSLNDILIQLSNIFNTDINLYDYTGFLMATSRPEVFYRNLTGRRMNNMAFLNMVYFRKSEYIQKEKIGALEYISSYVPFYNMEDKLLAYVNLPYFRMQSILAREISNLIVAVINFTLLLVLLAMSFAVFISGRLTSPLSMLSSGLASVKLGRKSEHLKYRGNDEIGELVRQYNIMVDEMEESAIKLRNSEREYAWREMAKQIAHEINNPLTPMKLNVQQLFKSWKDKVPDFEKKIERFTDNQIEYIENLSSIASAFSSFAKMPRTNPVEVDLIEQINTTLELFKNAGNVSFVVNWTQGNKVLIFADKEQLNGIFSNLIKNAIQSVPDDREGLVSIDIDSGPGTVIVTISDNGTGISEHVKSRMFTPNFTTKSSGMGLGLSIVKRYVENANGKIWFESQTGLGSRFFVEFPVSTPDQNS